jgi:hypothetical protein
MVDISRVTYEVELITETGGTYALTEAVTALSWEEQANELAQRATLTLANFKTDAGYLIDMAKLNCFIMIYANWDGTRHRMFGGSIWEWEYTSANEKELSLTAYDPLIRLQQSKHRQYYPPGMGTKQIIQDVCDEWGIPLDYGWVSISHPKKALQTQAISDIIIGLLEEVKNKTASKYTVLFRDEKMQIREQGSNASVYEFTGENVVSTTDRLSLRDLITRIKIIGKAEENTRPPIEAVVEGRTEFGVLQEILVRDSDKTLADAKAEAETLMKERGQPSEDISVTTVDLPFLRKGDRVRMNAGNLLGYFYVTGVSHNAIDKIMTMELCR